MFPFDSPFFAAGFITTVVVLVTLYVVVLIKLNPPSQGQRIIKKGISKQTEIEETANEQPFNPIISEETARENIDSVKRQERESLQPADKEKERNRECAHHFGYLSDHPKNTPIPNNCFSCMRIMDCLSANKD